MKGIFSGNRYEGAGGTTRSCTRHGSLSDSFSANICGKRRPWLLNLIMQENRNKGCTTSPLARTCSCLRHPLGTDRGLALASLKGAARTVLLGQSAGLSTVPHPQMGGPPRCYLGVSVTLRGTAVAGRSTFKEHL